MAMKINYADLIQSILRINRLFSDNWILSNSKIQELLKTSEMRIYKKGVLIVEELDSNYLYIVVNGIISINVKDPKSYEKIMGFFFCGDILYSYNINEYLLTVSKTVILKVDMNNVNQICKNIEKFRMILKDYIISHLKSELYFMTLNTEERYVKIVTDRNHLFLMIPSKYIASYIGVTPQALCRIRKRLLLLTKKMNTA